MASELRREGSYMSRRETREVKMFVRLSELEADTLRRMAELEMLDVTTLLRCAALTWCLDQRDAMGPEAWAETAPRAPRPDPRQVSLPLEANSPGLPPPIAPLVPPKAARKAVSAGAPAPLRKSEKQLAEIVATRAAKKSAPKKLPKKKARP
jgi:hypothetical protein